MIEIKIVTKQDNKGEFEKEVNDCLTKGWELTDSYNLTCVG